MNKMFAEERRNLILTQLQKEKRLAVKELAQSLNVSEATLRTDLNIMEEEGLLTRTHGGAVLNESIPSKNSFTERAMKNIEYKKTIMNKAIKLIHYKNSILLDEIGRASCRERMSVMEVEIAVVYERKHE